MTVEEIERAVSPEALFLEPRSVYDKALIDAARADDSWSRKSNIVVAVYDAVKCVDAIMQWFECNYEEAAEWFNYNTSGAWAGEGTPTFKLPQQIVEPIV
jgi:hypothetical protein